MADLELSVGNMVAANKDDETAVSRDVIQDMLLLMKVGIETKNDKLYGQAKGFLTRHIEYFTEACDLLDSDPDLRREMGGDDVEHAIALSKKLKAASIKELGHRRIKPAVDNIVNKIAKERAAKRSNGFAA